jgi:DNA-binding Xre family transcriptional regulator
MEMYHKLKVKMFADGITQADLAAEMGVSKTFISHRFTKVVKWDLDTVYAVCDVLNIPYEEIPTYFPKGATA